jgi:NADH-quinone oxidoreductase subunit J
MVAFGVLGFAALFGAVMVMMSENILHSAYWLLAVALSTAGIIWFLGAEYVAIVQLLVYAGAVGVLLIFTLMVTLRTKNELIRSTDANIGAFLGAAAFFGLIGYAILTSPSLMRVTDPVTPSLVTLGEQMFSMEGWVLPFEIVSLVLTVALIAAVWWTRDVRATREKDGE